MLALAEKLKAPVIKALLGKAVIPDDSPHCLGGIGLLGTAPSQDAMQECDTLIMAGTSFPYIEFLPKPGQAKVIQIDIDPTRIGLRASADVGLVGDCATVLELLMKFLPAEGGQRLPREIAAPHGVVEPADGRSAAPGRTSR